MNKIIKISLATCIVVSGSYAADIVPVEEKKDREISKSKLKTKKLIVVTQATNTSALRLYEKAGFRISDTKIWFHKWFA